MLDVHFIPRLVVVCPSAGPSVSAGLPDLGWFGRSLRDLAGADDELVAVARKDCLGQPERFKSLRPVRISGPEQDENRRPGIVAQPEELHLVLSGRPGENPVPVARLLNMQSLFQVLDGPLWDVFGVKKPIGPLFRQHPRIKRGLERPRLVVDEPLLVAADHLGAWLDPEPGRDVLRRLLNRDPRRLDLSGSLASFYFLERGRPLATPQFGLVLPVPRQRGDERLELLDHVGSGSGPWLDQF